MLDGRYLHNLAEQDTHIKELVAYEQSINSVNVAPAISTMLIIKPPHCHNVKLQQKSRSVKKCEPSLFQCACIVY